MNTILARASAAAVAALFALGAAAPANAAPIPVSPSVAEAPSNLILVKDHKFKKHGSHFKKHGNHAYFNHHRGYRHHVHGYRYYNGYWFPPSAFIAGVIVGGALGNGSYGNAHVRWCYSHYRSYRASDNTYQPFHGPRRQCVSPYN